MSRFAVVGAVNTTVHYSVYLVLSAVLPYALAHVGAMGTATVGSYLLNCRFTFGVAPGWRSFLLFPLATVTNLVLSTIAVCVAVELCGIDARAATVPAGLVAMPVTFVVARACLAGPVTPPAGKEPDSAGHRN